MEGIVGMKRFIARIAGRIVARVAASIAEHQILAARTSPSVKIALRTLFLNYRRSVDKGEALPSIWETGFRVFSQFDEDGIIVFLLGIIGVGPGKFVDIGGGDGVSASNAANLALNFGFHGLFIDGNQKLIEKGEKFYTDHPDTSLYPPKFRQVLVNRRNINQIIRESGFEGEIDLLSIDIDGNDYWIWEAVDCIQPRIVVIETHVEFGLRSIAVPYREELMWQPGMNPHYLGASPAAMTKLANRLGYRLVGANRFGFNAFYVRNDLGHGLIPEMDVQDLFHHPRNIERVLLFEPIKDFDFVTI
jgi:hypothetical protein